MDTGALVRRVGGRWSSPSRRGFALEQELERLIQDYPEVLPGVSAAALAVDQFSVPSGGSVDLVVLEPDASITVVECKLAKNAEVRRAVVGQTLSCEIDGRRVTVSEVGDVANPKDANGENAQIASSQAFKRCAMRLGLGLHLWSGELYFLDKALNDSTASAGAGVGGEG